MIFRSSFYQKIIKMPFYLLCIIVNSDLIVENRPSWDEYFMGIARAAAARATCDRGKSGCVIARDKRLLTTGYVGAPIGLPHCDEVDHQFKTVTHEDGSQTRHCVRTSHAEENAIVQAARHGISLNGATLYSKMVPCYTCAKMIINSGIQRVVSEKDYQASKDTKEILNKAGVELTVLNNEVEKY
jgi:dCMP deaminase